MIKQIKELIPKREYPVGVFKEEHEVIYTYDTSKIKWNCVECGRDLGEDIEKNYIKRGNTCKVCHDEIYYPKT